MPLFKRPLTSDGVIWKGYPEEDYTHQGCVFQRTGTARTHFVIHPDWVSEDMNIPQFRGRKYKPWPYEFHGARYWSVVPTPPTLSAWRNGQWMPDALTPQELDIIRPKTAVFLSDTGIGRVSRPWESSSGRQFQLSGGPKFYQPHRLSEHNMSTPGGYSHMENPQAEYHSHRLYAGRLNGNVQESIRKIPASSKPQMEKWGAVSSYLPSPLAPNGQPRNSFVNFVNSDWIKT